MRLSCPRCVAHGKNEVRIEETLVETRKYLLTCSGCKSVLFQCSCCWSLNAEKEEVALRSHCIYCSFCGFRIEVGERTCDFLQVVCLGVSCFFLLQSQSNFQAQIQSSVLSEKDYLAAKQKVLADMAVKKTTATFAGFEDGVSIDHSQFVQNFKDFAMEASECAMQIHLIYNRLSEPSVERHKPCVFSSLHLEVCAPPFSIGFSVTLLSCNQSLRVSQEMLPCEILTAVNFSCTFFSSSLSSLPEIS